MRSLWLFLAVFLIGSPFVRAELPEFFVRGGLPNVRLNIASAGRPIRIAFLGGSITATNTGWRSLTLDWFRAQYPQCRFEEIFAAVAGTGSDYGAARLQRDVLRHAPDLIFIEFAVNDQVGSPRVEQQMEGIVRQTWAANPTTDICLVYTVSAPLLPDLMAGRYQSTAVSMEKVAEHYRIPALNWGVMVAQEIAAGRMVMWAPAAVAADAHGKDPQGRLIFTRDHTHPTLEGHRDYAQRLSLALPGFLAAGMPGPHSLPPALSARNWERARIVSVGQVAHSAEWQLVPDHDSHVTTQSGGKLTPPTWAALRPGANIEFDFEGNVVGLVGIKGPENGEFEVAVDDLPPEQGTLFDSFATPGHYFLARWFFAHSLPEGRHHVRLKLLATPIDKAGIMARAGKPITQPKLYAPDGLYLSGFLLVGDLAPGSPR